MSLAAILLYHLLALIEPTLAGVYWISLQAKSRLSDRRDNWKARAHR